MRFRCQISKCWVFRWAEGKQHILGSSHLEMTRYHATAVSKSSSFQKVPLNCSILQSAPFPALKPSSCPLQSSQKRRHYRVPECHKIPMFASIQTDTKQCRVVPDLRTLNVQVIVKALFGIFIETNNSISVYLGTLHRSLKTPKTTLH